MSPEQASILPAGTVTFLITDPAPAVHAAVAAHGGALPDDHEEGGRGLAVFGDPADAVAAALDGQRALAAETPAGGSVSGVRLALHTGDALLRDDRDYTGPALARCVRLRDVAHGGQILLSSVTAAAVGDELPGGSWLEDLGAHRLHDLSRPERVFELRHADLAHVFPPLRSLDAVANNLPTQLTSFVGRADELAAVERLLTGDRLVTLTGSGGCGKTRLAMQAAADLADRWTDGVWWVDLSPISDASLVPELVASTIGVLVEPVGGPLRALTLQLRDRRLLLCLDNCEHLLDASAELAEGLLRSCPEVTILATSREPLGAPGETLWRVPSLAPGEAVALFAERAERVRPWFALDATNEAAVRTICDRLDGIPLAIELAAAWLRTLTPAQIAAGLDDRFALLVRGSRGGPNRHQTLGASIDWSHDLLDDIDRAVLRRLAVFSGGFTLAAARAVCAGASVAAHEVLTALGRLVDKSLVVVGEAHGEARYRLLETIRQYAGDRLAAAGEEATSRDRHLDHFLALGETAERELEGADQDTWLALLETEHDNLRAAVDWGLSLADPDRGRRLTAALTWLWYRHGHVHEGADFTQRAMARAPDDQSALQTELLSGAAAFDQASGQFRRLVEHAQLGLELATALGDDRNRGRFLFVLSFVQFYVDIDKSWELAAQARECGAAADDPFAADGALVMQGAIHCTRDDHDAARRLLTDGAERCLRRGDRTFAALALNYLDECALRTGDLPQADEYAVEALRIAEPLGDYYAVGLARCHLAVVKATAGDIDAGQRLMRSVVRSVEGSDGAYVPRMGTVLGTLCLWAGDLDTAIRWFQHEVGQAGPAADSLIAARALPGLAAALRLSGRVDQARRHVDRAVDLAGRLGVPHLLADALEQSAHLTATDDLERAEDLHHEALAQRVDHGLRTSCVDSLDALGRLAADDGRDSLAARLIAASDAARASMGAPRPPVDQPGHQATVAKLRAALDAEELAGLWAEGTALGLDDAVAYVRRARGARGRPTAGWASLTPTELDVVGAVVEGLSNPEIGARLFMSRSTVKTHLSHIYAKLGVANRTELATLASARRADDPEPGR